MLKQSEVAVAVSVELQTLKDIELAGQMDVIQEVDVSVELETQNEV